MAERAQLLHNEVSPRQRRDLAYNPYFDIEAYQKLHLSEGQLAEEEFKRRLAQLNLRTRHNLETNLGERFQVELSRITYQMIDGQLYSPEHDGPFINVIKRGQDFRLLNGNPVDHEREKAEVLGFERVQEIFKTRNQKPTNAEAMVGKPEIKVIVISPRGNEKSSYQHNFFDIYQIAGKTQDKDDPCSGCFVTMSRYTSQATLEEFWQAARTLDPALSKPSEISDAYFLANPIKTDKSLAQILEILHPMKKTMTLAKYHKLIEKTSFLIDAYIQAPSPKIYNAILNFADMLEATGLNPEKAYKGGLKETVRLYGNLPVRAVMAGCGIQRGFTTIPDLQFAVGSFSPFSVSEFGMQPKSAFEDQYGTREIHCEECGRSYLRDMGTLEKRCRFCGGTKGITC